jgi:hypothetical protein
VHRTKEAEASRENNKGGEDTDPPNTHAKARTPQISPMYDNGPSMQQQNANMPQYNTERENVTRMS